MLISLLCCADQMIRNGNVELQAREEEIRFMKMQINEEKRSIAVLRAQTPNKVNLEQELVTLQIQVIIRHLKSQHFPHFLLTELLAILILST